MNRTDLGRRLLAEWLGSARTRVVWFKICLVVLATVVARLLCASFA